MHDSGTPSDTPGGTPIDHPRRILDDPLGTGMWSPLERAAWAAVASATSALQSHLESAVHRECGMTPFEYHLMLVLVGDGNGGEEGELPMSVAAHRVDSSLSRLSHVVRRLEGRGWLIRRGSPKDARVTLVRLSDDGLERVRRGAQTYNRIVHEAFTQHLTEDELRSVLGISRTVLASLKESHWLLTDQEEPDARTPAGPASPTTASPEPSAD